MNEKYPVGEPEVENSKVHVSYYNREKTEAQFLRSTLVRKVERIQEIKEQRDECERQLQEKTARVFALEVELNSEKEKHALSVNRLLKRDQEYGEICAELNRIRLCPRCECYKVADKTSNPNDVTKTIPEVPCEKSGLCEAGRRDGIVCPPDSCDFEDGTRDIKKHEWHECSYCEGEEGWHAKNGDWQDCPQCEGSGGWWFEKEKM